MTQPVELQCRKCIESPSGSVEKDMPKTAELSVSITEDNFSHKGITYSVTQAVGVIAEKTTASTELQDFEHFIKNDRHDENGKRPSSAKVYNPVDLALSTSESDDSKTRILHQSTNQFPALEEETSFITLPTCFSDWLSYFEGERNAPLVDKTSLNYLSEHMKSELLISAINHCEIDLIKMLLDLKSENSGKLTDKESEDLLQLAFKTEDIRTIKIVKHYITDQTIYSSYGSLLMQVIEQNSICKLKLLISIGANVEYTDTNNNTPIMKAAQHGRIDAIILLVESGANINHYNAENMTALNQALIGGDLSIINTLLECGATFLSIHNSTSQHNKVTRETLLTQLNQHEIYTDQFKLLIAIQEMKLGYLAHIILERPPEFPLSECKLIQSLKDNDPILTRQILNSSKAIWLNFIDENGDTLLHYAVKNCSEEIVELLIEYGFCIHKHTNNDKHTALDLAIVNSKVSTIKTLLSHSDKFGINTKSPVTKLTPVTTAALYCDNDIIKLFLEKGADVNLKCGSTNEAPMRITAKNQRYEAMKLIAEYGGDFYDIKINEGKDNEDAILFDHILSLHYKIGKNRKVHQENLYKLNIGSTFYSILQNAIHLKLNYIVKFILGREPTNPVTELELLTLARNNANLDKFYKLPMAGVNVNFFDNNGNTPLHFAVRHGNMSNVIALVTLGAKVHSHVNKFSSTPLSLSYHLGQKEISLFLLEHSNNEDIDILIGEYNKTLMSRLVNKADLTAIKCLLHYGANPDARAGSLQQTPLIIASYEGNFSIVSHLLKVGANPDILDNENKNALYYAIANKHFSIANILLLNGATPDDRFRKLIYWYELGFNKQSVIKSCLSRKLYGILSVVVGRTITAGKAGEEAFLLDELELLSAAKQKNGALRIESILSCCNVKFDFCDEEGNTALHLTIKHKQTENLRLLAKFIFTKNLTEDENELEVRPLSVKHIEETELTVKPSHAINRTENNEGYTPLQLAVKMSNYEAVEALLEYSKVEDINYISKLGNWTCMSLCTLNGDIKIASKLKTHGANFNSGNFSSNRPVTLAIAKGNLDMIDWLCKSEVNIDIFICRKDKVTDDPNADYIAHLSHFVAKKNDTKIIGRLLESGLRINVKNRSDLNAFEYAKQNCYTNVLKAIKHLQGLLNEKPAIKFRDFEDFEDFEIIEFS